MHRAPFGHRFPTLCTGALTCDAENQHDCVESVVLSRVEAGSKDRSFAQVLQRW
jgi:hypothetical protein